MVGLKEDLSEQKIEVLIHQTYFRLQIIQHLGSVSQLFDGVGPSVLKEKCEPMLLCFRSCFAESPLCTPMR